MSSSRSFGKYIDAAAAAAADAKMILLPADAKLNSFCRQLYGVDRCTCVYLIPSVHVLMSCYVLSPQWRPE